MVRVVPIVQVHPQDEIGEPRRVVVVPETENPSRKAAHEVEGLQSVLDERLEPIERPWPDVVLDLQDPEHAEIPNLEGHQGRIDLESG